MKQFKEKELIQGFLAMNKMCVLSTINVVTAPESALVAFAEDSDLNIYFQTKNFARKAHNLENNPRVSLVIGWDMSKFTTLQYEGKATLVDGESEIHKIKTLFIDKDSPAKAYLDVSDVVFFKITPAWLRYSDYSQGPPRIVEHSF